jgi:hypothetical protein
VKLTRIIIGIICIAISIWMFISNEPIDNPVLPIVVLMIGIIVIAVNKRKR